MEWEIEDNISRPEQLALINKVQDYLDESEAYCNKLEDILQTLEAGKKLDQTQQAFLDAHLTVTESPFVHNVVTKK